MSVSASLLGTSLADGTDQTSFVLNSTTYPNGKTIYLCLGIDNASPSPARTPGTITGGPSFSLLVDQLANPAVCDFDSTTTPLKALRIYRATGDGSTGSLTVPFGGTMRSLNAIMAVIDGDNVGANAVQIATARANTGTALATTLASFADAANATFIFGGTKANTTLTKEASHTLIDSVIQNSPNFRTTVAYLTGEDTSPAMTAGGSDDWGIIAVEIPVAPSGGGGIPSIALYHLKAMAAA